MTEPTPPPQYPVGSIVNGHVWTGAEWVPVQVMPTTPPPRPMPAKPPLSTRFQALDLWKRLLIMGGVGIGGMFALYQINDLFQTLTR